MTGNGRVWAAMVTGMMTCALLVASFNLFEEFVSDSTDYSAKENGFYGWFRTAYESSPDLAKAVATTEVQLVPFLVEAMMCLILSGFVVFLLWLLNPWPILRQHREDKQTAAGRH